MRCDSGARIRAAACGLALVALAGAGLTACTGDSEGQRKPSTSAGASAGSQPRTELDRAAAQVTQQHLTAAAIEATAIASVKGEVVVTGGEKVPGTADLVSVQAGANSTAVRWRMATDDPDLTPVNSPYQTQEIGSPDVSAVTLVAAQANLLLRAGHWHGEEGRGAECTCSWLPRSIGPGGFEMSILYEALPASVTEVELHVPGFPALVGPVSRS